MDMLVIAVFAGIAAVILGAVAVALISRANTAAAAQAQQTERALGALDQANDTLASMTAALEQTRDTVGAISRQQAIDTALAQQRHESVTGELGKAGLKTDDLRREISAGQDKTREAVEAQLAGMREDNARELNKMSLKMDDLRREISAGQDKTRATVEQQLTGIRDDNARQLERMRETVDEKLSKTLNDRLSASFKQVSDSLDMVSKDLGEMRGLASGVGDLKRVLSNVKTRGILGEVQLGAILREILSPDQYLEDTPTVPDSRERVEFAVKLPVEGGDPVLLPIDSKFPGDAYEHLRQALEEGDAAEVVAARKLLEKQIKQEAKEISEKYVSVPYTTNFGIMFLPFEGLYAEVVNMPGLVEQLQRDHRVNVAGPSTMAAILNSLQMSYQTFAFQKRADEIQKVLSAVKAEFPNYQRELRKALRQIKTAEKTVDSIINTRTNVMQRKLQTVTAMDDPAEVERLLSEGADEVEMVVDDEE